ncbi:MAG TPA: hypothetical protein VEB67_02705, partial [Nitrososphaerales archaeon]|nr:hypothetical protein [Nitrososphaerales archaeon]
RTALVAGLVFLRKNGYKIDLKSDDFVAVVDRVGVAAASLDDLFTVMSRLTKKSPTERKGWDKAISQQVSSNRKTLTDLGA